MSDLFLLSHIQLSLWYIVLQKNCIFITSDRVLVSAVKTKTADVRLRWFNNFLDDSDSRGTTDYGHHSLPN